VARREDSYRKGIRTANDVGGHFTPQAASAGGSGVICEAGALLCVVIPPACRGNPLCEPLGSVVGALDSRLRGNDRPLIRGRNPNDSTARSALSPAGRKAATRLPEPEFVGRYEVAQVSK
jgi:hypothetical protein